MELSFPIRMWGNINLQSVSTAIRNRDDCSNLLIKAIYKEKRIIKRYSGSQEPAAHTCNPSYMGG
jgi:hypothetical protein